MPLDRLEQQLRLFGVRTGIDALAAVLPLLQSYAPRAPAERWIAVEDGFVVVQGTAAATLPDDLPPEYMSGAVAGRTHPHPSPLPPAGEGTARATPIGAGEGTARATPVAEGEAGTPSPTAVGEGWGEGRRAIGEGSGAVAGWTDPHPSPLPPAGEGTARATPAGEREGTARATPIGEREGTARATPAGVGEGIVHARRGARRAELAAALQRRGFAAAPLQSPDEARLDARLPGAAPSSGCDAFRPVRRPRVLDLTQLIAGPLATHLLALAGVEIVKVERPETGDPLRQGDPVQFARLNAGKRLITLDLNAPGGPRLLRRLAAGADLVIENLRGGRFARQFPDLPVPVLSMPGLAAHGPYAGLRSYAGTVHALLGYSWLAGPAPLPWADYVAGAWAANWALDMLASRRVEHRALAQAACLPQPDRVRDRGWPALPRRDPPRLPVPALGRDNDAVYGQLGLTEDEVNALYVAGVI